MTIKEAIEILKSRRICAAYVDSEYVDSVDIEAIDMAISAMEKRVGYWNNHKVACLLADMFGDDCACNFNGIDEWLPMKCDFAETVCPNPVGVACWEQFLKHRGDEHVKEFTLPEPQITTNVYDTEEIHHNCTVQILRNSVTGDVSVGWWEEKEEEE